MRCIHIHSQTYIYIYIYIYTIRQILQDYLYMSSGMMVRMFANGPGDLSSITVRVIPKIQKMVLDAA